MKNEAKKLSEYWKVYANSIDDQFVYRVVEGKVEEWELIYVEALSVALKIASFKVKPEIAAEGLAIFALENAGDITCLEVFEHYLSGDETKQWAKIYKKFKKGEFENGAVIY